MRPAILAGRFVLRIIASASLARPRFHLLIGISNEDDSSFIHMFLQLKNASMFCD
jgi:hypothetical protein